MVRLLSEYKELFNAPCPPYSPLQPRRMIDLVNIASKKTGI
jgi:hypothetical protein